MLGAETDIGVKRMGELDEKPFLNVCKKRFSEDEATVEAATLCSTWQENLKDSSWQPFRREGTGDKAKACSLSHCLLPLFELNMLEKPVILGMLIILIYILV